MIIICKLNTAYNISIIVMKILRRFQILKLKKSKSIIFDVCV